MGPFNKLKAKAKPRVDDDDDEMRGVGVSSRVKADGPVGSVSPTSGARPTKSRSFHAPTELQRSRSGGGSGSSLGHGDGQTVEELRDTVVSLKQSVMSHANSSAEAMEHFNALQKAHDTLYKEHVHLQEQMDDAVELLKYLKEEKGAYEARLEAARREAEQMRRLAADQGDGSGVVSMTIENLTKEKMDIEGRLRDEVRGREELGAANAGLAAKVAELTRTNAELEKRSAKAGTIEKLEGECRKLMEAMEGTKAKYEGEATKARLLYEAREAELRTKTESDAQSIERLTAERDALLSSHATIKEQVTSLENENAALRKQNQTLEEGAAKLNGDLTASREERDKLQDSLRETTELLSDTETKAAALKTEKEEAAREHENRLAQLERELAGARDGTAEAASARDEAVSDLKEMRAMHNDTVSSFRVTVEKKTKEIDALKRQMAKLTDQLSNASDVKTALSSKPDRSELDGLQIDDLPDHLLVEVASFLGRECRALWAVSMSAPSEHWTASSAVSTKGKQILTLQRDDWRKEWREFDFGDFHDQFNVCSGGDKDIIKLSLSDDDLKAVLICIDAASIVESLRLSLTRFNRLKTIRLTNDSTCITGRGLAPLTGSLVLRRIDISTVGRYHPYGGLQYECSLELGEVLPVLDSIVASNENRLRHIHFPQKWRDIMPKGLSRFIRRYNDMLDTRTCTCCQCDSSASPGIHEGGDRYGIQTATCYTCLKNFCFDDDGDCQEEWDESFEFCPSCERYFCWSCNPVHQCTKCYSRISCDECAKDISCAAEDCPNGSYHPYCPDCADEELLWLSCCKKYVCNSCSGNACDCSGESDYSDVD